MNIYGSERSRLRCRAVARMLQAYLDDELAEPMTTFVDSKAFVDDLLEHP